MCTLCYGGVATCATPDREDVDITASGLGVMGMRHSKGIVPERPPHFVERDEVRSTLEDQSRSSGSGRVVLVSAPTGHGKTAAVADWIRASADIATVWGSLDESDRDEIPWWRSTLGALQESPGVPEDSALHRLRRPPRGEPWAREAFVAAVLEALDDLPAPVHASVRSRSRTRDRPHPPGVMTGRPRTEQRGTPVPSRRHR
jgi:hypothetical protein